MVSEQGYGPAAEQDDQLDDEAPDYQQGSSRGATYILEKLKSA